MVLNGELLACMPRKQQDHTPPPITDDALLTPTTTNTKGISPYAGLTLYHQLVEALNHADTDSQPPNANDLITALQEEVLRLRTQHFCDGAERAIAITAYGIEEFRRCGEGNCEVSPADDGSGTDESAVAYSLKQQ